MLKSIVGWVDEGNPTFPTFLRFCWVALSLNPTYKFTSFLCVLCASVVRSKKYMHELGITQNIIAIVTENAKGKKVQRVLLEIGKLSAIMPESIKFCFDICAQDTILEGAILEILEIPGMAKCRQCGTTFGIDKPFGICECGSIKLDIITGEELKIKEIEVEELCV